MTTHERTEDSRTRRNKSDVVPFRLSSSEKARFEAIATAEGRTLSDYIRRSLHLRAVRKKKRPFDAVALVVIERLRRDHNGLANNINQLAKIANKNGHISDDQLSEALEHLKRASDLVAEIDRKMFGDEEGI